MQVCYGLQFNGSTEVDAHTPHAPIAADGRQLKTRSARAVGTGGRSKSLGLLSRGGNFRGQQLLQNVACYTSAGPPVRPASKVLLEGELSLHSKPTDRGQAGTWHATPAAPTTTSGRPAAWQQPQPHRPGS